MTMILDVAGAIAELLEPDPLPPARGVKKVVLDIEPITWEVETLYVYPTRVEEVPFETGGSRRQEFDLAAVYVTDNLSEDALRQRDPELAQLLDGKRGAYLAVVRANQTTPMWGMLRGRSDTTSPRTLDKRSASVRVSGWRIIGG